MTIPLVDLKAQYRSIKESVDEAVGAVMDRADFIQGAEVSLFENAFARFSDAREAVGVSSGTEALRLALLACGVGPGDEVITTPFTFIATVEAIVQAGAVPVFADIDPVSFNIDPSGVEAAVSPRTKAIVPVHLYGRAAEMDRIQEVATAHGLKIVQDAAQAHGATYGEFSIGNLGDVACYSFYPSKNLGAYGDAGMVTANDPDVASRVRLLRDHGRSDKYEHTLLGSNSRLDTLQAAILRVKLDNLPAWTEARRRIAGSYRSLLRDAEVVLPSPDDRGHVYHLFVVRSGDRDGLRASLAEEGATPIGTGGRRWGFSSRKATTPNKR